MAKKKKRPQTKQPKQKEENRKEVPLTSEPWISQRNGLTMIGLLSVGMFVYMTWQLYPTEGWGNALLWGSGFVVGIWAIFGISLIFNTWMRGRRRGDR